MFSGLSGDAMLGDYTFFARVDNPPAAAVWTLTATMNGEVVSFETGEFYGTSTISYADDSFTSYTDDESNYTARRKLSYYSSFSTYPESDRFTVTLGSYDPVGC